MATVNINFSTSQGEVNNISVASTATAAPGDIIRVTYSRAIDGSPISVTVSGFNTTFFTNSTGFTLTNVGQFGERTIRTGVSGTVGITFYSPGFTTRTCTLTIGTVPDTTPDDFVLNTINGVVRNSVIISNTIVVKGINTTVNVTSGGGATIIKNGVDLNTTSTTAVLNDSLALKITSSPSFSTTVTGTLTVGSLAARNWFVTTMPSSALVTVLFPKTSGNINLTDVINFYGGQGIFNKPMNLRAYLRGGAYVPDISGNSGIASSGNLSLRSFLGSRTEMYFSKQPLGQRVDADTTTGAKNLSVSWAFGGPANADPNLGYGFIRNNAEYLWSIVEDTSNPFTAGVTVSNATLGVWSMSHPGITINSSCPANTERFYRGVITVSVRNIYQPASVITTSFSYTFLYRGP